MKLWKLVVRNLMRRKGRTLLSIGGVASALCLMVLVESLSLGLDRAMSGTEAARTLIVYRKNRYCPQTSFLPEAYTRRIEEVPGVESVLPVKVYLNNCRASLDLVTFQGAPVDRMLATRAIDVVDGDVERFRREGGSALVGIDFARRKGLSVGDSFRFGDVNVTVAGIFESPEKTEQSLILTHLLSLQQSAAVSREGTVTQFEVRVADGADAAAVADAVDALFTSAEEPTDTRPQVEFLGRATRDLSEILRFGRWLGLACVIVVLSLVANTVFMSVQERVKEFGVFRTLGFGEGRIAALVVAEALALSLLGAVLGIGGAYVLLGATHLSIGTEGVTVTFATTPVLALRGLLVAAVVGAAAGLVPAVRSARQPIVRSLRA